MSEETGWSGLSAKLGGFGVDVMVTSMARKVFGCLGEGRSWRPMSAGRREGIEGIKLGGSNCVSVAVKVRCAIGAIIVRIWYKVFRTVL